MKKTKILVLSLASLTFFSCMGMMNPSAENVNVVNAEARSDWKRTDKFVDGAKFILAKEASSKIFVPSSNQLKSGATFEGDLLTNISNYEYDTCALTAEKVEGTDYFYLKRSDGNYLSLLNDNDGEGTYTGFSDTNKNGFKLVNDYLVADSYYLYKYSEYTKTDGVTYSYFKYNNLWFNTSSTSCGITLFTASAETTYDVTLKANGGSGSDVTSTVKEGEVFVLPENTFTYSGHVFTGWSDGEKVYAPGDSVVVDGNKEYLAQWRELYTYTVSFYDFDGTTLLGTKTAKEGDSYFYLFQGYSKTGYKLLGWSTELDNTVEYTNGWRGLVESDLTLYAVVSEVMDDVKPSVSIRTGEDAGLRFKFNLSKEQVNGTFDNTFALTSFKYGVAVVRENEFREISQGDLGGLLTNYNISNRGYDEQEWSYSGKDELTNESETLSIYNIAAKNNKIEEDGSAITFAGVVTGFETLVEDTIQDLEKKVEYYNTDFRAVGYVCLNDSTFKYTSEVAFSYMDAVNEYLNNAELYGLSTSQVNELTALQEKYGK